MAKFFEAVGVIREGKKAMDKEDLQFTFSTVNEWLRFSDAKVGAILAFQVAVLAAFVGLEDGGSWPEICKATIVFWLGLAGALGNLVSIVMCVLAIYPRVEVGESVSNIFFGHISKLNSLSVYKDKLADPAYIFEQDLTRQIFINSKIAWSKYYFTALAFRWAAVGYSCVVAAYIIDRIFF
jgi:hypothetical protein